MLPGIADAWNREHREMTHVPVSDRKEHESGRWGDCKVKKRQRVRSMCRRLEQQRNKKFYIHRSICYVSNIIPAIIQIENRIMSG